MSKDQPEPRGTMIPIYGIFNPLGGHRTANDPGHITGRDDPPPPDNKGVSIWPF